jgi:hypothetical protein
MWFAHETTAEFCLFLRKIVKKQEDVNVFGGVLYFSDSIYLSENHISLPSPPKGGDIFSPSVLCQNLLLTPSVLDLFFPF